MNYHIKYSKCPPLADTYVCITCGNLSQHCQWLSLVRQTKLTKVHYKTLELDFASVAAYVKTPALPPYLIIQWIEVGKIGATHY